MKDYDAGSWFLGETLFRDWETNHFWVLMIAGLSEALLI